FLRRVLREIDVAQHGKRASESHVLKANHKLAKRLVPSCRRAIDIRRPQDNAVDVSHVLILRARISDKTYPAVLKTLTFKHLLSEMFPLLLTYLSDRPNRVMSFP